MEIKLLCALILMENVLYKKKRMEHYGTFKGFY